MDTFKRALEAVFSVEGGFSNDPNDPGGVTNLGVTQATYNAWRDLRGLPRQPVRKISRDEAELVYKDLFWRPYAAEWDRAGRPGIALYVFDMYVQHRPVDAGAMVAKHREALMLYPLFGLARLHADRTRFYTGLKTWWRFGRGWMRRIAHIYDAAVALEAPNGLIRAQVLDLDGARYPIAIARQVGPKLFVKRSAQAGDRPA